MQGDAQFARLLESVGAEVMTGGDRFTVRGSHEDIPAVAADMERMPDAVMTLACIAAFARSSSVIRGVRTLRVKETDRVAALATELAKIGVRIESPLNGDADALRIIPPADGVDCRRDAARVNFDTYNDHRMAMSLSLIGLRRPNVWINNPACVAKTYPTFWNDWARLYQA
jgi:3-phosphoshikimate 1-carboxyvinyltransferase